MELQNIIDTSSKTFYLAKLLKFKLLKDLKISTKVNYWKNGYQSEGEIIGEASKISNKSSDPDVQCWFTSQPTRWSHQNQYRPSWKGNLI